MAERAIWQHSFWPIGTGAAAAEILYESGQEFAAFAVNCWRLPGAPAAAGGHVRLSLSLSLWFSGTLVSITHSLITAGRSLEASSFCQHPVECAPRISLWAASGDARVIDAKRRRSLAAEICGPRGMRNLVFFFVELVNFVQSVWPVFRLFAIECSRFIVQNSKKSLKSQIRKVNKSGNSYVTKPCLNPYGL